MEDESIINEIEIEDSIKEDRRWCVYIHRNIHNDKCYIGITSQDTDKRWGDNGIMYLRKNNGHYKHPVFAYALLKYPDWDNDWEHIIFAEDLSADEAKHIEKLLICLYRTNVCKYNNPSYGYNCTDGGDGMSGHAVSEETKNKLRKIKGIEHPRYRTHMSEETRKKLSESHKNPTQETINKMSEAQKGKKHTEETRKKMSEAHKKRYENPEERKKTSNATKNRISCYYNPVYCCELTRLFCSAAEAEKLLHISYSGIRKCCNGTGKRKSAGKHPETGDPLHWLSAEDAIKQGYITQRDLDDYLNSLRLKEKENYKLWQEQELEVQLRKN